MNGPTCRPVPEVPAAALRTRQPAAAPAPAVVAALVAVLADDLPPGRLFRLVSVDGGRSLDHDPTDSGAAVHLRELVRWIHAAIDQAEEEHGRR
ncbi:hypothetical protein M1L60_29015 [Actinoplanes sp. TRM 88003]|uniref:Uncharacterized protein n=1 Tax=Paractinoplanes aksuensis TaxID=2939490 RepID=A0ABT1DXH1_9ACTN|nr:hypothetical protein [Actinoplanes aksuensis]MCO8274645.1 hypothetical protein [Actinoplanes aksuensis]